MGDKDGSNSPTEGLTCSTPKQPSTDLKEANTFANTSGNSSPRFSYSTLENFYNCSIASQALKVFAINPIN